MNKQYIFNKLQFSYKKQSAFALTVPYFELTIKKPVRITGANASGKTTLLKLCAGLIKPLSGEIAFNGHTVYPIQQHPDSIIYVHQNPYIFKGTVLSNLKTALRLYKIRGVNAEAALEEIIYTFSLNNIVHKKHYELTTGEKQKTALARACVIKPAVLLLDEPSTGLDAEAKALAAKVIKIYSDNGTAVLFASHDIEFSTSINSDTIQIDNGMLKQLEPFETENNNGTIYSS